MVQLEMASTKAEVEVVQVLRMCTAVARANHDRSAARGHLIAAMTALGGWARTPRSSNHPYRTYARLVEATSRSS